MLEDLTPLYPEEWVGLIQSEYASLFRDSVLILKNQCRVLHPTEPMTLCIRKIGHTGSHGTIEHVSRTPGDTRKKPLLWEPSPGEKRHNVKRIGR